MSKFKSEEIKEFCMCSYLSLTIVIIEACSEMLLFKDLIIWWYSWHRILFVNNMVVTVFEQLIIVLSEDWVSDSRLPKSINFQFAKDFIVRFNLVTIQALLCPVTQHGPNYGLLQLFLDLHLDFG